MHRGLPPPTGTQQLLLDIDPGDWSEGLGGRFASQKAETELILTSSAFTARDWPRATVPPQVGLDHSEDHWW